jgi:hypothetical protein
MKKNIVLFVLFVLPIVAYLFFASGVNEFSSLPVLRPHISEFGEWKSQRGESVKLSGKITILNFGGTELLHNRGNYFNLNQKVYQRYHKFTDLQFVILCPIGTEENAKALLASLESILTLLNTTLSLPRRRKFLRITTVLNSRGNLVRLWVQNLYI